MCRELCGPGKKENVPADVVGNIVLEWDRMVGLLCPTKRHGARFETKSLNSTRGRIGEPDGKRVIEIPGSFTIRCLPVPMLTALRCPGTGVSVAALR
jgi:hypothetical protein